MWGMEFPLDHTDCFHLLTCCSWKSCMWIRTATPSMTSKPTRSEPKQRGMQHANGRLRTRRTSEYSAVALSLHSFVLRPGDEVCAALILGSMEKVILGLSGKVDESVCNVCNVIVQGASCQASCKSSCGGSRGTSWGSHRNRPTCIGIWRVHLFVLRWMRIKFLDALVWGTVTFVRSFSASI